MSQSRANGGHSAALDVRKAEPATRLVDLVFPGDTNHHGTLFGGVALSHMDKVAFVAASRHGHADFVTASCERVDFGAPAHLGEIVDLTGEVVRVGRRSLSVRVELIAEELLTGRRRLCSRGIFHMVAMPGESGRLDQMPPVGAPESAPPENPQILRTVAMVFPEQTSHYGSLFGGYALAAMGKSAFIAATRRCRAAVVMASSQRVDFKSQIFKGEVMELSSQVTEVGTRSMKVGVDCCAENLMTGERREAARGEFVMVALDDRHRPAAGAG